jgi:tetratricopeptide (TPR) repeat protein
MSVVAVSVAAVPHTPDVIARQIRGALQDLGADNGHHTFEKICRYYSRCKISPNVLPSTGPVGAGGDGGEDFKAFRSYISGQGIGGFCGLDDSHHRLAFACTIQKDKLEGKVKSDVGKIMEGGSVDGIFFFSGQYMPEGRQGKLVQWCRAEHNVELTIIDGFALSEELAQEKLYWIAERFLPLPGWATLRRSQARNTLPKNPRPLIGRDEETEQAACWLAGDRDGTETGPRVVVVSGPPGAGKTSFAVNLAPSVTSHYPQGQHYIDVPAAESGEEAPDLSAVLLRALDSDGGPVPADRQERRFRLRSVLAEHKIILVIDNVISEDTLRDLISANGPFALVVTSRARLTGLARDGVKFIDIGPLGHEDGARLASSIAGRLSEQESRDVASACEGLPIAIAIAASYIARRPRLDVAGYLHQVAHPDHGLDELSAGRDSVEKIIEQSYRVLSADQDLAMQVLGILPNTTVTTDVVTAAMGETTEGTLAFTVDAVRQTARILDDLFELNLIEQPEDDGYRLHSILYRFARRRASAAGVEFRKQIVSNACLIYAARGEAAINSIGFVDKEALVPAMSNLDAIAVIDHDRSSAVLIVEAACRDELWGRAVLVAGEVTPGLQHRGYWHDIKQIYVNVRVAGERTGNLEWQSIALHNLGNYAAGIGEIDEALRLYRQCWEISTSSDNPFMAYASYLAYGNLLLNLGHLNEAIPVLRHTLRAYRIMGEDTLLIRTLHVMGKAWAQKGQLARAEGYYRNALQLAERRSMPGFLPELGTALAELLRLTGRAAEALEECRLALERARAVGDRPAEATALREQAILRRERGDANAEASSLATALDTYRDVGDIHGQISTLLAMGAAAQEHGDLERAIAFLSECRELAEGIDDAANMVHALSLLSEIHGMAGDNAGAEDLLRSAEGIANAAGSDRLIAHVIERRALSLRVTGHAGGAIPLLQSAVRALKRSGEASALSYARAVLGEALMQHGRWQEASSVLRAVTDAPQGAVDARDRAEAFRFLATLYSRRGLGDEALDTGRRALTFARMAGSSRAEMSCLLTIGNILARMDRWEEAAREYEKATPIAAELRDMYSLLAIYTNQAVGWLSTGDTDKALKVFRTGISNAKKLGLADMEASLHINLGSDLAQQGKLPEAIAEFESARAMAASIANDNLQARATLSLARARNEQGDPAKAKTFAQEARGLFHSRSDWQGEADALKLEQLALTSLPEDVSAQSGDMEARYPRLAVTLGVKAALSPAVGSQQSADPAGQASRLKPHDGRAIHVADGVRSALDGVDTQAIVAKVSIGPRHCFSCRLPIAEGGQAELMILRAGAEAPLVVTLAHRTCARSAIVQVPSMPPEATLANFDVECLMLSEATPAVVVDSHSPWGFDESGKPGDATLDILRHMGFVDASTVIDPSRTQMLALKPFPSLSATLTGKTLAIRSGKKAEILKGKISFLPCWYQAARGGTLIAMFGNNLPGLVSDDDQYLIKAIESGNLVVAAIRLDVIPPGRNDQCVCEPRTHKKYKHCCGRPRSAQAANPPGRTGLGTRN